MEENKTIKEKKLGEELTLKVTKNTMSNRIFVEFRSVDGRLVLQKNFQDTFEGKDQAMTFQKSIKTIKDLRKYFGLEK